MLKGIDPLLNADVLHALAAMGHGDDLIICDGNFPAHSVAQETTLGKLLHIDVPAPEAVRAVLTVLPLDTFVDDAAGRMEVAGEPETVLPIMEEVQAVVSDVDGPTLLGIERFAFYERAKGAFAVIQALEPRFYGCFALRKGVIPPDEA